MAIRENQVVDEDNKVKDTTRVQLELPPKDYKRLDSLKGRTEATSYAEVVRNALKLYETLLDKKKEGHTLLTKSKEGEVVQLEFLIL